VAAVHVAPVYRRGWPRHRSEAGLLAAAVAIALAAAAAELLVPLPAGLTTVPLGASFSVVLLARTLALRADPRLLLHARALLAESLGHSALVVDAAGAVVAISDAAREVLGLADSSVLPTALRELLADPSSRAAEFSLGGPGPAARQFEVRITPVLEQGWPAGSRVVAVREITSQRLIEQRLERLAYSDDLTGLANRRRFLEGVAEWIGAGSEPGSVTLFYLDLDRLKEINDRIGHAAGDEVLRAVAQRLRQHAMRGEGAIVARLGGDEFAIALPGIAEESAACDAAERVLALLAEPMWVNEQKVVCSASIGIAILPRDAQDLDGLLQHADSALYEAKQAGRNRWAMFDARLGMASVRKGELKRALAEAVDRGELGLHYQPIVDLGSRRVVGAEALLRWNHPELGAVPPKEFIPLAEAFGLIVPIGEWVILEACRQIRHWREAGLELVPVSVNVSSHQLAEASFVERVARLLGRYEVEPHMLQLEITESAFLRESEESQRILRDLRAIGLRLSLDDFGTGYSALAYLTRIPLDTLKLDATLVRDVDTDPSAASVATTVIAMARGLGLKTVAEGIDRESLVPLLQRMGCDLAQGFLFSPAVPGEAFTSWLAGEDLPIPRPPVESRPAERRPPHAAAPSAEVDLPELRIDRTLRPATAPVPAKTPAEVGRAACVSQPPRYALLVDDDDVTLGPLALRLTRLGVLTLYTRFPDEAQLLAVQERERVRAVVMAPRTPRDAIRSVIQTLAAARHGREPAVVVAGAPPEADRAEIRALGSTWHIDLEARDEELRFVLNQAMALPEELSRRRTPRAPANLGVSVTAAGAERRGILTTLSEGGAFVEGADLQPLGTLLLLAFELGDLPIVAEARVVHVNEREGSIAPSFPRGMGLEFTNLEGEAVEQIAHWVKETLERYRL
jgi:diguanylate cyclase (GGDEF)-like protein